MRVALAQVDCLLGELDKNLGRAREMIARARAEGADLVVFPELTLTGYSLGKIILGQQGPDVALRVQSEQLASLIEASGEMSVVLGFYEQTHTPHTYNSAAYFERGSLLHLHRKIYLPTYGIYEERKYYTPGHTMRAFDTRFGRMAVLICNDAWQPFLPFVAVQDGAQALLMPANSAHSTYPGTIDTKSYWQDITRFYARMLECYTLFVNRVGEEGELTFWGYSHIVDPWGRIVAEGPDHEEALIIADIDLDAARRRRREVPLVKEARLALLSKELERLAEEGGDL